MPAQPCQRNFASVTLLRSPPGNCPNRPLSLIHRRMSETRHAPKLFDLFSGFFLVGVFGFGGVLPWARRMIVEQRKWLTATEFTEMLGLCGFLPGGNIMNVTVALGSRFHGILGAVCCFLGLMTAPVAIVIGLGMVYDRYPDFPPSGAPSSRCPPPRRPCCWRRPGKSSRRCAAGRWRSPLPPAPSWRSPC